MFRNYFKTAFRNLRRNKIYSTINILGLSLGLACGMLIILYVKDETSYDRFHNNVAQLYRICVKTVQPDGNTGKMSSTGILQGPRFADGIPDITSFVRVQDNHKDIQIGTSIKSQPIYYVDSNFFSVFNFKVLSGHPPTALRDPHSVVITEDIAKRQFGTTDALGKLIMLKDKDEFVPYTVTAVTKRCPENSSLKFEMLLPIQVSKQDMAQNDNWFSFYLNTFVVLRPGANTAAVEANMKKIYESDAAGTIKMMAETFNDKSTYIYKLQPYTDIHLSKDYGADNGLVDASNPMYSYILSGIALFILLIACINFVNLTVARSIRRAKEIGIRKVVGGERRQLIFQFLGESFILCFLAFMLAVLLVQLALPMFNELSNKALALSYLFDIKLVAGYLILFVLTSLLAGFYPSLVLSGYNPVKVLYSRFTLAGKNYLQRGLVVLQFTLASFLIIGTITIWSQFNFLAHEKLGYDDSHLVSVATPPTDHAKAQVINADMLANPAIAAAASKNGGSWGTMARINDKTDISFAWETVDEAYIPMLKIPVLQGRNFSKEFPSDSAQSVLVNEAFVKKAGWKQPLGQVVDFFYHNHKYTVIGVVKDYHFEDLTQAIKPQLFTMKNSNSYGRIYLKVNPANETAALAHIQQVFKKYYPLSPYAYSFKDEDNRKRYEAEARWKNIMLFGAVLTIFISCIGLFGLSVFAAEKRKKEIGIRKVLGASVSGVVTILSKDFLKLVIISLLVAIPLAWLAAGKWLENYPYRINLSWWMFVMAGIIVSLVALLTVGFHAFRAALANPVKSLRSE